MNSLNYVDEYLSEVTDIAKGKKEYCAGNAIALTQGLRD